MYGSNFVWWWFFFFKQKTAYEMRISDWSSDVCSSDLASRVRETLVDAVVPALEIAGIFGQVDAEMEQRPERLVGIAVIIFVDVLLLQIDGRGLDPFILRKADLSGEILRDLARPAEDRKSVV